MSAYNPKQLEEEVIKFWQEDRTFAKSVASRPANKPYIFYDGPPFATGSPHYGHIVVSTMKDVVSRFWTMKGFRVERRWGWDCHGLPIENIVEKELGTKSKKEIEEMGVAKFNELCRSKVLGYVAEWKKTINRLGRWMDMDHAYRTMDRDYMESVWWVFKQLWDKGLIYEDYRSMHICPRCETTLSQQEVSEGYKEVKDISATVKFKVKNAKEKLGIDGDVYILAWTTTPWTLPGNVALAVGSEIVYVVGSTEDIGSLFVVAKDRADDVLGKYNKIKEIKGKDLVGLAYEPLFPYYQDTKNAFRVVAGDFVSTEEGTGVVHIAPAFGDDDFQVGKRENIPLVQHVSMSGRMKPAVTDFSGQDLSPRAKGKEDEVREIDLDIIKYLEKKKLIFSWNKIVHSYPHCWRCDTPLLNYATSSWFVKVTAIKDQAIKLAKKINWSPEHIKEGRFGKWLAGARDWSISRQRFWASVMPVWQCSACKKYQVFGSVAELEEISGQTVVDLHKHIVDTIIFPCSCGGTMKRLPDVLDTWFDSGSMPYAQAHYPFENKEKFEASFPAEFIAEGQDQTRAWFYYLHVLATALFSKMAFKNVVVNGIVLAADGKKMSKKLQNYPDPNLLMEKYGADALRYYLMSSVITQAENLCFSEREVDEVYKKVILLLWNVGSFYNLYGQSGQSTYNLKPITYNLLDRWILAKLNLLIKEVTAGFEHYDLVRATRPLAQFIDELSTWYLRRSRERFKASGDDKEAALVTLKYVLVELAKVMAPVMPFLAERIYQEVSGSKESVHLQNWPAHDEKLIDQEVLQKMEQARAIAAAALAIRAAKGLKVRQPLAEVLVTGVAKLAGYLDLLKDELNVLAVGEFKEGLSSDYAVKEEPDFKVALKITLSEELKTAGLVRELTRQVNRLRKEAGLTINDRATLYYQSDSPLIQRLMSEQAEEIKRATLCADLIWQAGLAVETIDLGGELAKLKIKK